MKAYLIVFLALVNVSSLLSQWTVQSANTNMNINSLCFLSTSTGFAVGDNSKFYRTTNGGQNWGTITIPGVNVNLEGITAREDHFGMASGRNFIFITTNNGNNWVQSTFNSSYRIRNFYDGGEKVFAAAYEYNNAEDTIINARILMTTNYGINWSEYPAIAIDEPGSCCVYRKPQKPAIVFTDNNNSTGYFATIKGIYKTTDGGNSFNQVNNLPAWTFTVDREPPIPDLYAGVSSGGNLLVIKSTNEGATWIQLVSIPNTGGHKGFSGMRLLPTVNKIYITVSEMDAGFDFMQQDSSVYVSYDNGSNWYFQSMPVSGVNIFSIDFIDGNTGWAVGSGGTILKTTNGGGNPIGIQIISSVVPKQFSLFQNYPNPFNPATKIKFSIPASSENLSYVKLEVYDITGKIVETLLDKQLAPGTYQTEWNAENYSSGIYFYKIEVNEKHRTDANSYTETKKMLLIK